MSTERYTQVESPWLKELRKAHREDCERAIRSHQRWIRFDLVMIIGLAFLLNVIVRG